MRHGNRKFSFIADNGIYRAGQGQECKLGNKIQTRGSAHGEQRAIDDNAIRN